MNRYIHTSYFFYFDILFFYSSTMSIVRRKRCKDCDTLPRKDGKGVKESGPPRESDYPPSGPAIRSGHDKPSGRTIDDQLNEISDGRGLRKKRKPEENCICSYSGKCKRTKAC
jgi:hypothetical protein